MARMAFAPLDLARFALSEFERGLADLSEEDAGVRMPKADGTCMNSIARTVGHIAGHWLGIRSFATGLPVPDYVRQFGFGSPPEEGPPLLSEVIAYLHEAGQLDWLEGIGPEALAAVPSSRRPENLGMAITRATLHTWFHIGEVNAVRQMLGHREIAFVGDMLGRLEPSFFPSSPRGANPSP